MPQVEPDITSPSNPKIKRLVRLRDRRHREAEGVFAVEGRELSRALQAGMQPLEVYGPEARSIDFAQLESVAPAALAKASYRSDPEATIGVFSQFHVDLSELDLNKEAPLVLVAESLEKPGNLGAVLRTADGVGADLVMAPAEFDLFNPNVIRSSTGAVFSVPVVRLSPKRAVTWLRSKGVQIVAAHPTGGRPPWEIDLTGPLAIVVGDEHSGLSGYMRESADQIATIPMKGTTVDSLNSAVAAAIVAFESMRQRL